MRRYGQVESRGGLAVWLVVAVFALASGATAQPQPVGPEFQVNTTTGNSQLFPAVAMAPDGTFVVVWQSSRQDTAFDSGVFGRLFDSSGNPLGGEFAVNTTVTGDQDLPSVAMDGSGNFVVVWESEDQDNGYTDAVIGRRFDAAGAALGGEFQVNTYTPYDQRTAFVRMDPSGNFVVAWQSDHQLGVGSELDVFAQRFDSYGVAQGGEIQVNTYTVDHQGLPEVGIDDSGNFVIAWQSFDQDLSSQGVFAQRFDASGAPQGPEFQVNTYTSGNQDEPSAAMDPLGNFVIAWESAGQDGSGEGVYAQSFDAAGTPLGGEFRVNTTTFSAQEEMSVATDALGNFVVAWDGSLQDGSGDGIFAQMFYACGAPFGGEFQVNTYTSGDQRNPSVAFDGAGNFVVAWDSEVSGSLEIRARLFVGLSSVCSETLALGQDAWHLIALPCEPDAAANTVQDVFADDLDGIYGTDWAVVAWDAPNDDYVTLSLGTPLEVGVGYWIKTLLADQSITVEGTDPNPTTDPGSLLAGAGCGYLSPELVEAVGNCQDTDLSDGRFNLLGFPFHDTVHLSGALVREDTGGGIVEHTFPEAEAADLVSDQIWTWSGGAYQARDTCTPGLEAELSKWDGFWVDVCETASTLEVALPAKNLNLACDPPPPPGGAESETLAGRDGAAGRRIEGRRSGQSSGTCGTLRGGSPAKEESWYLRLVASADGLSDPGNVLGELPDSTLDRDAHDLVELPPFGDNWLTIVFPHTDWGADSSDWYTSDYHGPKDPREWSFEVRSSEARTVTLTWEFTGDEKLIGKLARKMELVDEVTGTAVPAESGSYTFTMSGTEHPFAWLGRRSGGGPLR